MIELRWVESNLPEGIERTLQYRQKIDVTVRAGVWDVTKTAETANWQWSDWKDVPVVRDSF